MYSEKSLSRKYNIFDTHSQFNTLTCMSTTGRFDVKPVTDPFYFELFQNNYESNSSVNRDWRLATLLDGRMTRMERILVEHVSDNYRITYSFLHTNTPDQTQWYGLYCQTTISPSLCV